MADNKDWTWVLERRCTECGFDATAVAPTEVGAQLLESARALTAALDAAEARRRPAPEVWSPLEYACHVRDVCRIFDTRLQLMLTSTDPVFANWDQDATAVENDYASQDPTEVGRDLLAAAQALADRFDATTAEQWQRTGTRSDGARFTVATLGQYLAHDPAHHAFDVTGVRQERLA